MLLFLTISGKPFAMIMTDKITEKVGKKGQVVNSNCLRRRFVLKFIAY
ncbi:MAG: hypothetical protein OEX80_05620 [Candidatus Aminicenantes bacterium]|nr:hypothetical protein [Candidatus Aminicenantes bacterium]